MKDIIGVYLQVVKGYIIYPGTCISSTLKYEYMLGTKDGLQKAFVFIQAKNGGVPINTENFKSLPGIVYLFTVSEEYDGKQNENIILLSKNEIREFIYEHKALMRERVKHWLSYINPRGS